VKRRLLAWSYPDRDDDSGCICRLKRVRQIGTNTRKQSFQGSRLQLRRLDSSFDDIRDCDREGRGLEARQSDLRYRVR